MNSRPRGEDRVSVGTASLAFGDAVAEWEVSIKVHAPLCYHNHMYM